MQDEILLRALKLYAAVGLPKEKLFTDISTYVRLHYVYASPEALILARLEYGNWFVELAVGDMRQFFKIAPFKTEYVGFARSAKGKEECKWYKWERIERLVMYDHTKLQRQCSSATTSTETAGSTGCSG